MTRPDRTREDCVLGGDMVQEDRLSSVLSDFARTMATDFPIQAILGRT